MPESIQVKGETVGSLFLSGTQHLRCFERELVCRIFASFFFNQSLETFAPLSGRLRLRELLLRTKFVCYFLLFVSVRRPTKHHCLDHSILVVYMSSLPTLTGVWQ